MMTIDREILEGWGVRLTNASARCRRAPGAPFPQSADPQSRCAKIVCTQLSQTLRRASR